MIVRYLNIILLFCLSTLMLNGQINVDALYSRYENNKLAKNTAIDSFLILNQIARSNNNEVVYNSTAKDLLDFYNQRGNLGLSFRLLTEMVEVNSEWNNNVDFNFAAQRLAEYYREARLYKKARYYLQLIEKKGVATSEDNIKNMLSIVQLYGDEGRPDSAEIYLKHLERTYPSSNAKIRIARVQKLADIYLENQNYEKAKDFYVEIEELVIENKYDKELFAIANNLGFISSLSNAPSSAIEYFLKAEAAISKTDTKNHIKVLINLAIQYNKIGNQKQSELYLLKANKLALAQGESQSLINHLLSELQLEEGQIYRAEYYNGLAIDEASLQDDKVLLSDAYYVAAIVQTELLDYERALQYYEMHLNLRNKLENELQKKINNASKIQEQLNITENEIKYLKLDQIRRETERKRLLLSEKNLQLVNDTLLLSQKQNESALLLSKKENEVQNEKLKVQQLEAVKVRNENELLKQSLNFEIQKRSLDSIKIVKKLELDSLTREQERIEQEATVLKQDNAISKLEIAKQNDFKKFISIIALLSGLIFFLTLLGLFNLRGRNKIIKIERERSDVLLHSILPQETAEELKSKGYASPKSYDMVTVLFTDFTDFTRISSKMSAEELIKELEICFSAFDDIIKSYEIERIKIIGDSYMCAGGVPVAMEDNPDRVVGAAIEMQKYMLQRYAAKRKLNLDYWQMRIGIHTGPVVAGVVGKNKFAYDIWGDSVNIASRLENQCEAEKIIVSTATKKLLNKNFKFEYSQSYALKGTQVVEAQYLQF